MKRSSLVIWHQDRTAYLLDLAWLEEMNGLAVNGRVIDGQRVDKLSPARNW